MNKVKKSRAQRRATAMTRARETRERRASMVAVGDLLNAVLSLDHPLSQREAWAAELSTCTEMTAAEAEGLLSMVRDNDPARFREFLPLWFQ